ncbi:MAG: type II secretion system protein GspL [Chloroflexota bacterium]
MIGLRQITDLARADFLTSVGLYITNDRLIMVRLRKSLLTISMLDQEQREFGEGDNRQAISELTGWVTDEVREIALRAEGDARERALRQAIVSLLPQINAARDAIYVCLPQEQAIVQQVFLPLAAQDNVRQVLDYEIERQLPFKREDIYFDYLVVGKKGEKLSVYVFAIPKKNLDGFIALLNSFGINPRGVETTATALANCLIFAHAANGGSAAVVASHSSHWELIGVEARTDGWQPAAGLLFSHRFPHAEWAHGAGHEVLQECLQRVPKIFRCGDLTALNGAGDERLGAAEDMAVAGQRWLPSLKPSMEPDAIPAIGAALRGVREASLRGNLLHSDAGDNDRGKSVSMLNWALAALLLISLVGWAASFPIKDELRLRQLQRENQKLAPTVDALRREDDQLQRLRKELAFIDGLEQRRGEVLRVLDDLSKVVPNSAYLSNLRYRSGVLEVQGNAENASALVPLLERSPVFENVNFNAPSNRGRDNRETFSLKADIEKPKGGSQETPQVQGTKTPPAVKDTKAKP